VKGAGAGLQAEELFCAKRSSVGGPGPEPFNLLKKDTLGYIKDINDDDYDQIR
jgi:hypothetical protein